MRDDQEELLPKKETIKYGPPRPGELVSGNEDTVERISQHIEDSIGPIKVVFHELVSEHVHVDVYHVEPSKERPFHTFVTSGMSDEPMITDDTERRYAEAMILLPPEWPVSEKAFEDENHWWPLRELKGVARFPHVYSTWLGYGHSIANGEDLDPYAPNTRMCATLLMPSLAYPEEATRLEVTPDKTILFWTLYPIYKEELDFKLTNSAEALFELMQENGVTDVLDPQRVNLVTGKRERPGASKTKKKKKWWWPL